MSILAFVNQKGGVGKTTCVLNIGAGLSINGKKVLLVDIDPQANLSSAYGSNVEKNIYHCFYDGIIEDKILKQKRYHLLPSGIQLAGLDAELGKVKNKNLLLKNLLEKLSAYDYILIDCPPALNILTLNALIAAQHVYIPMQCNYFGLKGLTRLIEIKNAIDGSGEIKGIIPIFFDSRRRLDQEVKSILIEHFGSRVFKSAIRESIYLAESVGYSKDIFEYGGKNGIEDFEKVVEEILNKEENNIIEGE